MSKLKRNIGKIKLAFNKAATNLGLRLTTRKIQNDCLIAENIPYVKHKLQKYEIVWPSTTEQKWPLLFFMFMAGLGVLATNMVTICIAAKLQNMVMFVLTSTIALCHK